MSVPFKPTVCLVFSIRIKKADTLEVVLYDEIIDLEVHLYYTVFDEYNIIARHTVIINKSDSDIKLFECVFGKY